jgi:dsDNA-specific endonuclease/ATPase MutS2
MIHRIDLHGLNYNQAVSKVENELIGISLSRFWEVEIITGKSKHMQHKIINEILEPMNFYHFIPHTNPGIIVVMQDELLS